MAKGTPVFTRDDVYKIRELGDAGIPATRIKKDLFPHVATETIRKVIRRDTFSDLGVGATERVAVSSKLIGEKRLPGSAVPQPRAYRQVDEEVNLQEVVDAGARERAEYAVAPPMSELAGFPVYFRLLELGINPKDAFREEMFQMMQEGKRGEISNEVLAERLEKRYGSFEAGKAPAAKREIPASPLEGGEGDTEAPAVNLGQLLAEKAEKEIANGKDD